MQKKYGKGLFGSGFIVSDKAAAAAAAAAVEKNDNVVVWKLSEREKEIVKSLGSEKT